MEFTCHQTGFSGAEIMVLWNIQKLKPDLCLLCSPFHRAYICLPAQSHTRSHIHYNAYFPSFFRNRTRFKPANTVFLICRKRGNYSGYVMELILICDNTVAVTVLSQKIRSSILNWDYNLTTFIASILGSFAKLRKSAISFVMPVAPSVRTEQHGSHWTDFHEILYLSFFWRKSVREN